MSIRIGESPLGRSFVLHFFTAIGLFLLCLASLQGQDLYSIGIFNTESGNVEVGVLSRSSNFQLRTNRVTTARISDEPGSRWQYTMSDFDMDGVPDLVGTVWDPNLSMFAVHILSGASNYRQSLLDINTPLYSNEPNGSDYKILYADLDQDGKPDLVGVRLYNSSNVEVHALSGSSNYQTFIAHAVTPRPTGDPYATWAYDLSDFNRDGQPDLVGFARDNNSGQVSVHILSGANNFQQSLLDVNTPLTSGSGSPSDYSYVMGDLDNDGWPDLVGIKMFGGGSVEVHALSGSSSLQQWIDHVATSLRATENPSNMAFSVAASRSVVGISSIAYIDENTISTYSATEVDYATAAYYDTYVESCLYQDGSSVACGHQTSAPGDTTAAGYLNSAITAGPHYQLQTNHYIVAPFAYVSAGANYYYNPYGYGFASQGGDYSIDSGSYWSAGAAVYIGYAAIYLGSTGLDAYTPLTSFNRGDLQNAIVDMQYNGNGTYTFAVAGPGWEIGFQNNLLSGADILRAGVCATQPELCVLAVGGGLVIYYVGPKLGEVIRRIVDEWHQREQAPFPYPGNDPTVSPGAGWQWKGSGPPSSGKGNWVKDTTGESLHPDLGHPPPIGPHWDYVDPAGKDWRVWPDGTMSPK